MTESNLLVTKATNYVAFGMECLIVKNIIWDQFMSNAIKDLQKLAGIDGEKSTHKAIVLLPENTGVEEMKNLLNKLKEIDGSVDENWTEVCISGVKFKATGIRLD